MGGITSLFKKPKAPDTSGMERAAADTTALQKQIYEESVQRGEPFYQAGVGGVGELQRRLGLGGDAASAGYGALLQEYQPSQLTEDPGYQFRQQAGQQALERRLAAQGKTFSPEAAKALMEYNQGLASQEYGAAFDRSRAQQQDIFQRLYGLSGMGQSQAAASAGLGQGYGQQYGQTMSSLANAQAAAQQAAASRQQSMFGTLLGLGGTVLGGPIGGAIGGAIGRRF